MVFVSRTARRSWSISGTVTWGALFFWVGSVATDQWFGLLVAVPLTVAAMASASAVARVDDRIVVRRLLRGQLHLRAARTRFQVQPSGRYVLALHVTDGRARTKIDLATYFPWSPLGDAAAARLTAALLDPPSS